MTRKRLSSLAELEISLAEDLLFGPIELARRELTDAGLDPDEIGATGQSFVAALKPALRSDEF